MNKEERFAETETMFPLLRPKYTLKQLPDGRRVFECRCGTTVAITTPDQQKLKIYLQGSPTKARMEEATGQYDFPTGGRCPRCQHRFKLDPYDVVLSLDYASFVEFLEFLQTSYAGTECEGIHQQTSHPHGRNATRTKKIATPVDNFRMNIVHFLRTT